MTEDAFAVLLLISSFFSLAGLHYYSSSLEPVEATVSDLLERPDDFAHYKVGVFAFVDSYYYKREGLAFLSLSDSTGSIKAVHFGAIKFSKGSFIHVVGRVQEYKGELEFIVEGVR